MQNNRSQYHCDQRGFGTLGLIIVVFLLVVAVLGGVVVFMIMRAGGLSKFVGNYESAALTMTPSKVLQAPPTQYRIDDIVTRDDPFFGNVNAKLTIVEFGDFECPFCREAFPTIREVMTRYKKQIRFIYRDFLNPVHPRAAAAAEAAECVWAGDREKFWAFHDKLFQNQENLSDAALQQYAVSVGVNSDRFAVCVANGQFAQETQSDYRAAIALGVRGTPTWFIVFGDKIQKLEGPQNIGFWEELIERAAQVK